MPEFPRHIDVYAHLTDDSPRKERPDEERPPRKRFSLTIDGQEFPWFIAEDGVTTTVSDNGYPVVTITIPAERVTTDHRLRGDAQ